MLQLLLEDVLERVRFAHVLQGAAVCCSVLQCVAVRCNVLQPILEGVLEREGVLDSLGLSHITHSHAQ